MRNSHHLNIIVNPVKGLLIGYVLFHWFLYKNHNRIEWWHQFHWSQSGWQHLLLLSADKSEEGPSALCIHSTRDESLLPLSRFPFTEGQGSASFVQNCFLPGKLAPQNSYLATWVMRDIMITFRFSFLGWSSCFQAVFYRLDLKQQKFTRLTGQTMNKWTMGNYSSCDMDFTGKCNKLCVEWRFVGGWAVCTLKLDGLLFFYS